MPRSPGLNQSDMHLYDHLCEAAAAGKETPSLKEMCQHLHRASPSICESRRHLVAAGLISLIPTRERNCPPIIVITATGDRTAKRDAPGRKLKKEGVDPFLFGARICRSQNLPINAFK